MEKKPKNKIAIHKILPSMITIMALCLGITAIHYAIQGKFEIAVSLVFAAGFMDLIDGKVARLFNSVSEFGAQLDSLADLSSFGVAPGIIVYLWCLHEIPHNEVGWGVVLIYISCSALRLARYNTVKNIEHSSSHVVKSEEEIKLEKSVEYFKKNFFVGLPMPAAAVFAFFPMAITFEICKGYKFNPYIILFYVAFLGYLMVSSIPIFSGKHIKINKKQIPFVVLILWGIIISIIVKPWIFTPFFTVVYAVVISFYIRLYYKKMKSAQKELHNIRAVQKNKEMIS